MIMGQEIISFMNFFYRVTRKERNYHQSARYKQQKPPGGIYIRHSGDFHSHKAICLSFANKLRNTKIGE